MLNKKKLQTCKPDPVIPINRDCHHLSVPAVTHRDQSAYPVSSERAALKRYYTWHFSMQGLPANDVTIKSCGLLPHIFTLIPIQAG